MLPSVIDSDQTGFTPRRATDVNLRRLFANIHTHHINEGTHTVAYLDIEKVSTQLSGPSCGQHCAEWVPFDIY